MHFTLDPKIIKNHFPKSESCKIYFEANDHILSQIPFLSQSLVHWLFFLHLPKFISIFSNSLYYLNKSLAPIKSPYLN